MLSIWKNCSQFLMMMHSGLCWSPLNSIVSRQTLHCLEILEPIIVCCSINGSSLISSIILCLPLQRQKVLVGIFVLRYKYLTILVGYVGHVVLANSFENANMRTCWHHVGNMGVIMTLFDVTLSAPCWPTTCP